MARNVTIDGNLLYVAADARRLRASDAFEVREHRQVKASVLGALSVGGWRRGWRWRWCRGGAGWGGAADGGGGLAGPGAHDHL